MSAEEKAKRVAATAKTCTQCGHERLKDEFPVRRASVDGRSPICRKCANANESARRKAKPDQCKAVQRDWYQRNKAKHRNRVNCWIEANREHYLESKRQYAKANAVRVRESQRACELADPVKYAGIRRRHYEAGKAAYIARAKQWRREHPEEYRQFQARRRARIRGAGGHLSLTEWREILEVFDHRCAYCLKRLRKPTQDHVEPISRGGRHAADNVVPACNECNGTKQARTLLQLVMLGHGVVCNSRT